MSLESELLNISQNELVEFAQSRLTKAPEQGSSGYDMDDDTKRLIGEKYPALQGLYTAIHNKVHELLPEHHTDSEEQAMLRGAGKVITILVDFAETESIKGRLGITE